MVEEGKEAEEKKLVTNSTIQTREEEEREDDAPPNELNELPEGVLLHMMKYLDTKHAVRTSVLSNRWRIYGNTSTTSLSATSTTEQWPVVTNSCLEFCLLGMDLFPCIILICGPLSQMPPTSQNSSISLIRYAVLHNVQQMTITVNFISTRFFPLISSCQSLTSLKLCTTSLAPSTALPGSLRLPALKSLHLDNFIFNASGDDGRAEPFSACNLLNTLVIKHCSLQDDVEVLCISNSNLCSLTLGNTILKGPEKTVLSTPNLRSLSVLCDPVQLSASDLSLLELVNIDITSKTYFHACYIQKTDSALVSLLQVLADYVKTLILSSSTLEILKGLLISDSVITQIPCFVQLKTLKLKMKSSNISDEEVSRILGCLVQKSPADNVDVINF